MLEKVEAALRLSLDHDLVSLSETRNINLELAMLVQMVRLLRGKTVPIVDTPSQGWSPDDNKWYPSEPGTFDRKKGDTK